MFEGFGQKDKKNILDFLKVPCLRLSICHLLEMGVNGGQVPWHGSIAESALKVDGLGWLDGTIEVLVGIK